MNGKKKEFLALIPARGGSKSVPRKNLLSMLGRPLVAWSIHHALRSKFITRVIVSTDDQEIADVARAWGAEVPFLRPSSLAQDHSLDLEAFQHALNWLQAEEGYLPDLVVHLRPTGPARRIELIDRAIQVLLAHPEADSLRSVSLAEHTPYKMWLLNDDGSMRPAVTLNGVKEAHSVARQMLPKAYWQNGYVDVVKPATILDKESMVGDCPLPFIIGEEICDVDYFDDIPRVESALKAILDGQEPVGQLDSDRHPV